MMRDQLLEAARAAVCGDRQKDYGDPADGLRVVGKLWKLYVQARCVSAGADVSIEPEDVAAMMCLLKTARIATGRSKADNWVDLAGYAALGGELQSGWEAEA